jgi:hypothetical protein
VLARAPRYAAAALPRDPPTSAIALPVRARACPLPLLEPLREQQAIA